ncbi:hypothetical protein LUZ63_020250 [Rhynchospora breviuscula]|uniref:FAD-binding domain-containing protein n=1 Tax=Rhynchospora breviuscula TaxID=2022672 RepID=A0A9Q0BZT0_9POAL|nr:hypothetical protein LUZ63_020250 [Rhynchospora breviuscula]
MSEPSSESPASAEKPGLVDRLKDLVTGGSHTDDEPPAGDAQPQDDAGEAQEAQPDEGGAAASEDGSDQGSDDAEQHSDLETDEEGEPSVGAMPDADEVDVEEIEEERERRLDPDNLRRRRDVTRGGSAGSRRGRRRSLVDHPLASAPAGAAAPPPGVRCEDAGVSESAPPRDLRTDVLVVGAGPAGSAAAAWAARAGLDVVLADAAVFPRDKTCGDGLTPRAVAELGRLGLEDWVRSHTVNRGLRAHGFGRTLHLRWPGGSLPDWGSAVPRTELDAHLRDAALAAGARAADGARAVDVRLEGDRVAAVVFRAGGAGSRETYEIACDRLVVADGVRSGLGKALGREWHRDTVYGVAGRSYLRSQRAADPWISSHLELRGEDGEILSGYGWIFPLGDAEGEGSGMVNLGVGTLATAKRPADVALRPLMAHYAEQRRAEFGLEGELQAPTSALLPMGGAVSGVAGPNWVLVGDAAACVNPLNGEGIDYGLETGRWAAELLAAEGTGSYADAWPALLGQHYAESFSIARRLAGLVTVPRLLPALGPVGMRSTWMMTLALRWMGNLVTDEDRDAAARVWRWAGRRSVALDHRPPFA